MRSYRLLFFDKNGALLRNAAIDCAADQEAIAEAERNLHNSDYIEIWNGGRPVCICARPSEQPRSEKTLLERWCGWLTARPQAFTDPVINGPAAEPSKPPTHVPFPWPPASTEESNADCSPGDI